MSLLEIGQTLKTERKRQKLSLEDVYSATKIGLDILMAIEEAESDKLPHHVYTRGFIRNYADYLGLSGEELVRAFDEAMQEDDGAGPHGEARSGDGKRSGRSRRDRPRTWPSVVLILILLLVLVGLVNFFFLSSPEERTEQGPAPSVAENATRAENAIRAENASRAEIATRAENASRKETMRGEAPSGEANASRAEGAPQEQADGESSGDEDRATDAESEQSSPSSPVSDEAEVTAPSADAEQGGEGNRTSRENATAQLPSHELRIVASEACWISVKVDDSVSDFYLEPGEERTIAFRGTGTFLLGNAGGVTLYLDGEEYSIEAESGEVREVTLP